MTHGRVMTGTGGGPLLCPHGSSCWLGGEKGSKSRYKIVLFLFNSHFLFSHQGYLYKHYSISGMYNLKDELLPCSC